MDTVGSGSGVPTQGGSSTAARGVGAACVALACVLLLSACGAQEREAGGAAETSPQARDSAAVAALIASDRWSGPSCRWLEHGAWVLAYRSETALLRAAAQVGYIRMEQVGQGNRTGNPEPAWRITLTDAGRAAAATCPPTSKPDVWGVPVSRRELVSASFVGSSALNDERMIYDVEYRWVPTRVGERVARALTGTMAVEAGTYRTRVYLLKSPELLDPSGWAVDQIDELGAERVR